MALSTSRLPPGPEIGTWPMARAVDVEMPSAISSSSVQNVPSNNTRSALFTRLLTSSSIAPHPGANTTLFFVAVSRNTSPTVCPARDSRANLGASPGTENASTVRPPSSGDSVARDNRETVTSANARVVGKRQESCVRTSSTASVEYTVSFRASRSSATPSVWSSSASVSMTASIGTCRYVPLAGMTPRISHRSWSLTSGDALHRYHRSPSALTAIDDCDLGCARAGVSRATLHVGQKQFHWGNPPPAAVPSRTTLMGLASNRSYCTQY